MMSILAALKVWLFWLLLFIKRIFYVGGFFGLMTYPISFDWASLLVRVATGLALLPWGLKKFSELRRTGANDPPRMFAVWLFSARAGFITVMLIELVMPLFLIAGLCTRLVVIPGIASMAIALWASRREPLTSPALIFILFLITIFFIGSGQYSLDYLIMKSI